jgi:hypothetical protein
MDLRPGTPIKIYRGFVRNKLNPFVSGFSSGHSAYELVQIVLCIHLITDIQYSSTEISVFAGK